MKYSIIVPAHNSAKFIKPCLESIKNQSFTDYELIVVCDQCTDTTAKVVKPYADVILRTDYGTDASRQAGVDVAQGEWVLFLDDDDYWMHEYVLELIDQSLGDKPDVDMLCFGFIFRGKGYAQPIRHRQGQTIFWPSAWNKCYRRPFILDTKFRNVPVDKEGNAPDIDWTSRLLKKPFRYGELNQPLYYYNFMRKGSQTETKVYG